jgi:N-acetylneuraminic acid mutarotase
VVPVVVAVFVMVAALLVPTVLSSASTVSRTFTWSPIATMPLGTNEAQSLVVGDKLYIFGGFDTLKQTFTPTNRAWAYDPAANHWSELAAMPYDGITHAGIATDGSRYIYYAGGNASSDNATYQVYGSTKAVRYDIETNTYSDLPDLPDARSAGGMAYVGGKLFYFGGNNLDRTLDGDETWMLDVADGATAWVLEAFMPDPRNHIGWGVIDGKIYAVGGQHLDDSSTAQSALDRYDPATNTWTVLASEPTGRSHTMDSTFVMDGKLIVSGGWSATAVSAAQEVYDPASNSWTRWSDLPQARTSATAKALSGDRILFCCGSAGTSNATGWIATPVGGPVTTPPTPTTVSPTPAPATSAPATSAPPQPKPQPTVSSTPTGTPEKPGPPVARGAAVHPSTLAGAVAGTARVSYTMTRAARVTLTLVRCSAGACTQVVARLTVGTPRGPTHVSLHAISRRTALPAGHYRVRVTPAGGATTTLKLVVKG